MTLNKLIAAFVASLISGAAIAGTATLNYTSSGSSPIRMTTDGSSNNLPNNTIWDSAAGANGLGVTVNNAAKTEGVGTAGTPVGGILTVQGVASMTPLTISGTVTAQQGGAPWSVTQSSGPWTMNLTQVDGTALGAPVAWGSTPSGNVQSANVNCVAGCNNTLSGSVTVTNVNANGQATSGASSPVVLSSNQSVGDPCTFQAKTNAPFSTASGTTALVTGVSGKRLYVCSMAIIVPAGISVSLSEGSSATCGTSNQGAVMGVATNGTAANGMPFASNGGLTYGASIGSIAQTATAANYLCLFQSSTAQLAGNLMYVQQ